MEIPFLSEMPKSHQISEQYNLVLDAIFGFSFKGNVRAPFDTVLDTLKDVKIPLCAVDIPSGKFSRIFFQLYMKIQRPFYGDQLPW